MKTKILFFSFLFSFSFIILACAQNVYEKQKAGDNIFIHVGAGAQMFFGDNDNQADFKDRMTITPAIAIGKWLSPTWGVRVKAQGGALRGFENEGSFKQRDKYYNVHLDALWNLSNQFCAYSPNRSFSITPYLGLGFAHRFQLDEKKNIPNTVGVQSNYHKFSNALSVNSGFQLEFRLTDRVNLDFDFGAAIVPDYFDRIVQGSENEAIISAMAGLTYKFGKTSFGVIDPMNCALIEDLNTRINLLRTENEELSNQLLTHSDCPECPPAAPIITSVGEINYIPNVVFFQMNSSNVDDNQQINIYNTAEFAKENKGKIKVVGYADKDTGTNSYNLQLSEKRARAVANELITKYEISSQNIVIEWKGAEEQPYEKSHWNRVVVMTFQK